MENIVVGGNERALTRREHMFLAMLQCAAGAMSLLRSGTIGDDLKRLTPALSKSSLAELRDIAETEDVIMAMLKKYDAMRTAL